LKAEGDRLRFRPTALVDAPTLAMLTAHKPAILAALAPKPTGCAWREDEHGQLIFSDGTIYSLTDTGGWILTKHPTKRMIRPGTVGVAR